MSTDANASTDATACVKCDAPLVDGAAACRRCGLMVASAAEFAARQTADVPPSLHVAWDRVIEAWADGERHLDFVHLAALASQLAWASRQYRQAARSRPDDATATEMLARIARMAETVALVGDAGAAQRAKRRARTITVVIGVLVIALLLGAVVVYRSFRTFHDPAHRGAPPPSLLGPAPVIRGPGP